MWEDRTKKNNNCSQSDKTEGKGMSVHVYVFSRKNQVRSNLDGKFNVLGVENSLGAKTALNRGSPGLVTYCSSRKAKLKAPFLGVSFPRQSPSLPQRPLWPSFLHVAIVLCPCISPWYIAMGLSGVYLSFSLTAKLWGRRAACIHSGCFAAPYSAWDPVIGSTNIYCYTWSSFKVSKHNFCGSFLQNFCYLF